ncbi:MAG TPA: cytochrome c-type biogenesis CcmF C-terminal domain-containing protein [Acidimicrobiales bacterium]|nr:cytochrome c-type biogenesis CcmF C-terminal domain-containing protein [Acidimicrobiales bacterium]
MNGLVGHGAVLLGFAAALAGGLTSAVGAARGRQATVFLARRYGWLVLAAAAVAVGVMESALIGRDFSLAYVAANDSRGTPLLFRVTALWSALQGSILLWAAVLACYLVAMLRRFRARTADPVVGWATATAFAVAAFFFGLMVGPADPFGGVAGSVPADGPGPNPLLQNNPLVAFHPPLLYLGYVGFTVPFAFAVGALVTGRLDEDWLAATRRWTMFAWGCLTAGIVLGAWWSYQVLGWGGFWAWDPVENASLLPWLCATAYLHSSVVQQRRGMLRVWNISLLASAFSLTILGTFLTRSGVLQSVHSFSESTLGPAILAFFGLVVAVSVGLIAWRGDELRGGDGLDAALSREGAFLANNLVFGLFAFVVLLGTVFPLVVQAVNGSTVSVGSPYFNRMGAPLALCLLFLMAVGVALPWRRAPARMVSGRLLAPAAAAVATWAGCVAAGLRGIEPITAFGLAAFAGTSGLWRLGADIRRRSWRALTGRSGGGMVVHVGVAVVAAAFAASTSYGQRTEVRLSPGQSARFDGHRFTYLGQRDVTYPNRSAQEALVLVDGDSAAAPGATIARPAISQYSPDTQAVGTPWVISGPHEDLYLTLDVGPAAAGGPAVLGLVDQPLVMWLWVGGAVMVAGTVLAALPERRRRRRAPGTTGADREGAGAEPVPVRHPDRQDAPVPAGAGRPGGGAGAS